MNGTIIKEEDMQSISSLFKENEQHKETIKCLTKGMHKKNATFDLITELSSLENDYTDKIKENKKKILQIIYKYI